jgi:metal-responsive CopG/Arc/MetJ family transcriptional regulator
LSMTFSLQNLLTTGITSGYTLYMKTAISISDKLFQEIEEVAKKRKCSRSEVFAVATKEYLERVKSKAMLDTLDEVYSQTDSSEVVKMRKKAIHHFGKHSAKEPY